MPKYLKTFKRKLQPFEGSLVKVKTIKDVEPKAKEYLNKLSKEGTIERVKWGWYWIPASIKNIWDFLEIDRNFKVIFAQTAASFWNRDFIHRDVYTLKVKDKSYGNALQQFAKQRGWNVEIEYSKNFSKIKYRKVGNLIVEDIEDNVIECLQKWAFTDAFATLYENRDKVDLDRLYQNGYWKRISKTNIRTKQVLEYGFHQMEKTSRIKFPHKETKLQDSFIRREIDEAIERVIELG